MNENNVIIFTARQAAEISNNKKFYRILEDIKTKCLSELDEKFVYVNISDLSKKDVVILKSYDYVVIKSKKYPECYKILW